MRIVVFGAAGRTGRLVVDRALGHGHEVVAVAHDTSLGLSHARLTQRAADVLDLDSVRAAVAGSSAVVFAVSNGSGSGTGVHETGISNVIYAMAESGASRLAAMSAAGTFDRGSGRLSLAYRALVATTMRSTYDDLEAMERRVMATDLAWTIVRPYGLTDDPPTGDYRLSLDGSLLPKARRISRGDVASVLVKAVETDTYYRRAVVLAG